VAQKGLYLNQIRDYELPLPSKTKQAQIGKQLDALAAETQHLVRLYEQKLAALEALKKSLLHQAFTGRL
jgi:type I restriction enzyme S subunit